MNPQLIKIGKIKDAHSLKGDLYLIIFSKDLSWQQDLNSIYLGADISKAKKYSIKKLSPHKEGFILGLEGITNRNQAEALIGQMSFVEEIELESEPEETIFLREILQFEVIDQNGNSAGYIEDFSSNGAQDLLIINSSGKTFEMPFVAPLIQKIDHTAKKIYLTIPEGIQDL